jgi:hypothetical protein
MPDTEWPSNRVWFGLPFRDHDLIRLARPALNRHAAEQLARDHGLNVDKEPSRDDLDIALLVPTSRLADTPRELTNPGIAFGTVDGSDRDADAICQALQVVSVLLEEA